MTKIADLESIITPEGFNQVYMAAWYNGKDSQIFDITSYGCNTEVMLQDFWLDLINHNRESILYFHNWAGYDSILSLIPLLGLHEHGFSYTPIMQDGSIFILYCSLPEVRWPLHSRFKLSSGHFPKEYPTRIEFT